jgi:hypothetical protein
VSRKKREEENQNIEALKYALENQIGWQRYGEAKLLALITISGSSVASLSPIINLFTEYNGGIIFKIVIGIFGICSFVSFTIGLINMTVKFKTEEIKEYESYPKRLISWRYIKNRKVKELIEESKEYDIDAQRADLITQHHLGCFNTERNYKAFNIGARIYSVGVMTLFIFFLIFKIIKTIPNNV